VLGIETTCDETAPRMVERARCRPGRILSNSVCPQISEMPPSGAVPRSAGPRPCEALDLVIAEVYGGAGRSSRRHGIAVGPPGIAG